jgi:putative transposase
MDFMHDELADGRKIRTFNLVDKLSREALAIDVDFGLRAEQVINALDIVCYERGAPEIISVDNGSEFTSKALEQWAYLRGVKIHFIRPGKPTENGHIEAFNRRFRDECLDMNLFTSMKHAREVIEKWRIEYNEWRPHTSIGNLAPREFARRKMNKLTA